MAKIFEISYIPDFGIEVRGGARRNAGVASREGIKVIERAANLARLSF